MSGKNITWAGISQTYKEEHLLFLFFLFLPLVYNFGLGLLFFFRCFFYLGPSGCSWKFYNENWFFTVNKRLHSFGNRKVFDSQYFADIERRDIDIY